MIRLALVLSLIAAPAFAQGGWNSQNWGGGMTTYNGTGNNSGWSGRSQNWGGGMSTMDLNGPHGEMQHCSTQHWGSGQVTTNCN